MLTPQQLAQLETRLLAQLRGEDGDLAVLMAHIAQLTTHNSVMSAALAQFANKDNWVYTPAQTDEMGRVEFSAVWEWDGENDPQPMALEVLDSVNPDNLAQRALVAEGAPPPNHEQG